MCMNGRARIDPSPLPRAGACACAFARARGRDFGFRARARSARVRAGGAGDFAFRVGMRDFAWATAKWGRWGSGDFLAGSGSVSGCGARRLTVFTAA